MPQFYNDLIAQSYKNLMQLQTPSGLFRASNAQVSTGYDKAWFRDNIHEAMGLEAVGDWGGVLRIYAALFAILHKHKEKIEWACANKPTQGWQYIHARYNPETLEEYWEGWGNMQNDMVGLFLFKVGDLMRKGVPVAKDKEDLEMAQMLVRYLQSLEYFHDSDNGMWEEYDEIHASSVGNCVAGLKSVSDLVSVPHELIQRGLEALESLLPSESATKQCDLAQLSLIYPCNIVNESQRKKILENIEGTLVRSNGVVRYEGDYYYNARKHESDSLIGTEAEWVFGFPWLARIYKDDPYKYNLYIEKTKSVMTPEGYLPELYLASGRPNENVPLGWTEAMFLVAMTGY